jgi:hypothetical protein
MSSNLPSIFAQPEQWEMNLKMATQLSMSALVPTKFAGKPCDVLVAMDMARQTGIGPMEVMANLDVIEGKPEWKPEYLAGKINASRRFASPLRYEYESLPGGDFVRKTRDKTETVALEENLRCRAYATGLDGERVNGPWFSYAMAVAMGLWTRGGSQWPYNGEVMLWHRAAAAFKRMHAPDILMDVGAGEDVGGGGERPGFLGEVKPLIFTPEERQVEDEVADGGDALSPAEIEADTNPLQATDTPTLTPDQVDFLVALQALKIGQNWDDLTQKNKDKISKDPQAFFNAVAAWKSAQ